MALAVCLGQVKGLWSLDPGGGRRVIFIPTGLITFFCCVSSLSYKPTVQYGGGAGGSIGFSVRYQGELLGIWDLQNRDDRRKSPPETEKSVC